MTDSKQRWIVRLDGADLPPKERVGGKAWSIAHMLALGLDVPPAFVITTEAHAAFLAEGRFPEGLENELGSSLAWLESRTGRRFGEGPRPLLVSVRSGAAVSMPGMMDTVLNLGMTDGTEAALAIECKDANFAQDSHLRFLQLYADIVLKAELADASRGKTPVQLRQAIRDVTGTELPQNAMEQLHGAVEAVFRSWDSRRARRYREHHGIPHTLGTAVTVQAMVFGNLDRHSGTGVLFSRNPLTGEAKPFGEYLRCAQGEDVVSGKFTPEPLAAMAASVPDAHRKLLDAAGVLEQAAAEVQDIEFTVEQGRLFLLQARNAKLAPRASVESAVAMVREGLIDEATALQRISPERIRVLLAPRLQEGAASSASPIATGEGACPGVGIGIVVTDADEAERRAAAGEKVVLARPTTSPNDLHGMIAAVAVVTEEGGSTSHSAVVSRALGIPCVVGCGAGRLLPLAGTTVTVDGQTGRIFDGKLEVVTPDERSDPTLAVLTEWAQKHSPLQVFRHADAPQDDDVVDLTEVSGGIDPDQIASILTRLRPVNGARGGAIASDNGVRGAVAAGLKFIIAEPVLPPLLAAVQTVASPQATSTAKKGLQ